MKAIELLKRASPQREKRRVMDTYTGECNRCHAETDLINGLCLECDENERINKSDETKEDERLYQ
jgi:hypothetical protein